MPTADQKGMRRSLALCLLLCLSPAACLEMEQTVSLGPDGSGRQVVKFSLRESTLQEVQRASQGAQLGAATNPGALFDKELVGRSLAEAGMTMSKHAAKREAGRRAVDLEATFPDFASLQKSPLCGSGAEWVLVRGPREGTAKLTLYPQGKAAWLDARAKAEAMAGEKDPVADEFFRKRQQSLTGMNVVVRFELPGEVLLWTRNLEKTGDREVEARITAAKIQTPGDLVRWLAPRFEVIFDATGCKLPLD
ncbi:MAG TPA: hypothetical protein VFZ65_21305 [Planctomycetota bacterium]|nr:hypothetical protein [Planctomycetota bacterium]